MSEESYYTVDSYASVSSAHVAQEAMLDADVGASNSVPTAAVMAELLASLGDALGRSSTRLDEAMAGTTSALQTLRAAPRATLLRESLAAECPGLLDRVNGMIAAIPTARFSDATERHAVLGAAARELTAGLDTAALRLAVAERAVQLRAVSAALESCGFRVSRTAMWKSGRAALVATGAGRTAVTVEIDPARGHLNLDLQGMEGLACDAIAERIKIAMQQEGLSLSLRERRTHGDPRGGALIRRLQQAVGSAPAQPTCPPQRSKVNAREGGK